MPIIFENVSITSGLLCTIESLTPSTDPAWSNVSLLMNNTTTNNQTNNAFLDGSTNNATVTRNGTPTQGSITPFTVAANTAYSTSVNGGSSYFNGSTDSLTLPASSNWTFGSSGDFTLELWVNTSGAGYRTIISNYNDFNSGYQTYFMLNMNGTTLEWPNSQGGVGGGAGITRTITQNTWNHVAVVRSGSAITMYVNGVSAGSITSNTSYTGTGRTLKIGGGVAGIGNLTGYLSGIRIVNGTAVYTSNFTPPTAPPTAISGTNLLLNFTNAGIFDATTKNNFISLGNAQVSTTQAKFGSTSVYFDGVNSALTMPDGEQFTMGSGNFTIEAWIYTGVSNSTMRLLGQMTNSITVNTISFAMYTEAGKMVSSAVVGSTFYDAISSANLPINQWVHVAFVRNGGTITQYINGIADSDGPGSNRNISSNSLNNSIYNFSIGRLGANDAQYWNGYVSNVRITKGQAVYTGNFTPPATAFPTY